MNSLALSSYTFRWPSLERRIILLGAIFPLAFDFKKFGEEGGIIVQSILVGLTLLFGGLYVLLEQSSPRLASHRSMLLRATIIWWLYLILSPLPVFVLGVNIEHYLKVILPFILFGLALLIMCSVERRNIDPFAVLNMLLWAVFFAVIWRVVYVIGIEGLSLDGIRWQILSPGVPYLIGFGIAGIYLKKRRMLSYTAFLLGFGIAALSVTRSYLISLFSILLGLLIIEAQKRSLISVVVLTAKIAIGGTLIIMIGAVVVSYFRPDMVFAWIGRMTGHSNTSGVDLTLITRLAELKGQWTALTQSAVTILIGNGIGANYQWDQDILASLPFDMVREPEWFAGHSTWSYSFFSSGLVLGFVPPLILIFGMGYGCISVVRRSADALSIGEVMSFLIALAYVGQSFTSNVFSERYGALILGVIIGSMFIYGNKEKKHHCF